MRLTDRDCCLDMLMTEKFLADMYNHAEAECAHPRLREELHTLHSAHEAQHAELFKEALKRGWYRPAPASPEQVQRMVAAYRAMAEGAAVNPGPARAGH